MNTTYQQRVITVPRGHNVGKYIVEDLRATKLLPQIEVKTINSIRDSINRSIVVTIEYILSPKPNRPSRSLLNT